MHTMPPADNTAGDVSHRPAIRSADMTTLAPLAYVPSTTPLPQRTPGATLDTWPHLLLPLPADADPEPMAAALFAQLVEQLGDPMVPPDLTVAATAPVDDACLATPPAAAPATTAVVIPTRPRPARRVNKRRRRKSKARR